jgi:hypothetical protein
VADTRSKPADPVFVGGTGRSGTTIVGRLLGEHSQYALIPFEARFHAEPRGLPGVLTGRVTMDEFLTAMRERWFILTPQGKEGGLNRFVPEDTFETALEEFSSSFSEDRLQAGRSLVRGLLDPVAEEAGKPSWVEMTPRNVFHASTLHQLFPDMGLIHCLRDGRDTASSLVARNWQPDMQEAIRWWGRRLRTARRTTKKIPRSQLLPLRLEALVQEERQGSYRRLLEFLGVEDEDEMHEFFETSMTRKRAHIGRWRESLSEDEIDDFLELYREIQQSFRKRRAPERG